MPDSTQPDLGATQYYKTTVNGDNVYQALPFGGNHPFGYTPVSKDEYVSGLQSRIGQLTANPSLAGGSGDFNNVNSLTKNLQDVITNQGIHAPRFRDPEFAKFNFQGQPVQTNETVTAKTADQKIPLNLGGTGPTVAPTDYQKDVNAGIISKAPVDNNITPTLTPEQIAAKNAAADAKNAAPHPTNSPISSTISPNQLTLAGNLGIGSKGSQVSELQTRLGITADGNFGPITQQAVKNFQSANGLVADGIVGPKTLAALNNSSSSSSGGGGSSAGPSTETIPPPPGSSTSAPDNGKTPFQNVMDTYTQVYKQLGLTDIKTSYEGILKQQSDIQTEKTNKANDINNNPWYSEGERVKLLRNLDNNYKTKENTMTHLATLYDSLYKEGVSQAQYLTTRVETDTKTAMDLAQKKADALANLQKDNEVRSIEGHEWLISKANGAKLVDLGETSASANPYQDYNAKKEETQKTDQATLAAKFAKVTGMDGYIGAENYKAGKAAWVAQGHSGADFDKIFGGLVNPSHPGDYSASFLAKPFGQ